jgi:hypothetical protein
LNGDLNFGVESVSFHQGDRNRLAVLQRLLESSISDNELELLVQVMNRPDIQTRVPVNPTARPPSPMEVPLTSSTSRNPSGEHHSRVDDPFDWEAREDEQNQSDRNNARTPRGPRRANAARASATSSLHSRYRGTSEGGVFDDFTLQGTVNLLPDKDTQNNRRLNVVSTCASPSGDTLGVVCEQSFWVYKSSTSSLKLKCMAKIDSRTHLFKYGLDDAQHTIQRDIINESNKRGFGCAALSDNLLAVGASHSDCFMLFSVADEEQGRCIFKSDPKDSIVHKIMFNPDTTEFVVLSALSSQRLEIFQFFSAAKFCNESSGPSRRQSNYKVHLNMKYTIGNNIYSYETMDASFSSDGRKIVICTKHNEGSIMVFILEKDDADMWVVRGPRRIDTDLDNRDDDRLGFTGVSLYV